MVAKTAISGHTHADTARSPRAMASAESMNQAEESASISGKTAISAFSPSDSMNAPGAMVMIEGIRLSTVYVFDLSFTNETSLSA